MNQDLKCQQDGCDKTATFSSTPNTATDPHMPDIVACDEHLTGIGMSTAMADPPADHFIVRQL